MFTCLYSRSLSSNALCPICDKEEESIEHALFLCEHTITSWFGSNLCNLAHNIFINSIFEWWENCTRMCDFSSITIDINSKIWTLALWWAIWKCMIEWFCFQIGV